MENIMTLSAKILGAASLFISLAAPAATGDSTQLLWGDTHVHSTYSFDAFLNQNQSADPDTAYRWAKGLPVIHPYNRTRVQINTPLDFLVVSDHAELMGVIRAIDNDTAVFDNEGLIAGLLRRFRSYVLLDAIETEAGREFFNRLLPVAVESPDQDPVLADGISNPFGDTSTTQKTAWHEIVDAAERHNNPGKFTSLIGWEWSSIPSGVNLHRVVITPENGETAKQFQPYGSDQSQYPEDLWQWLEATQQETGARFLAIPHNPNISKGYMFAETTLRDVPITAEYARRRMEWEPVAEVTQLKGDSETHPALSPNDEFADFETYQFYIQQQWEPYQAKAGDYIRPALLKGLAIEQSVGVNPFKFGLIGSTDAHTGLASAEENNFWGKMARDSIPENKRADINTYDSKNTSGWNMGAQGLAGVWAEENSRDAIFSAFQRKEVYATTGPRIAVRFFAGWNFTENDAQAENIAELGYANGVPMGGDLIQPTVSTDIPKFLIRAVKDPKGANLDRVQVIKGWVDADGKTHEKIYNAAWSAERKLDANGQLPAVANTVDISSASYTNDVGSAEFSILWSDPDFNAQQKAFYYVRVLQIPTPRHSLYDAVALQTEAPQEAPATIQERAYTSPIWYTP